MYFRVEAQGDVLFLEANSKEEAEEKLFDFTGPIPEELLSWSEVEELPEDADVL